MQRDALVCSTARVMIDVQTADIHGHNRNCFSQITDDFAVSLFNFKVTHLLKTAMIRVDLTESSRVGLMSNAALDIMSSTSLSFTPEHVQDVVNEY